MSSVTYDQTADRIQDQARRLSKFDEEVNVGRGLVAVAYAIIGAAERIAQALENE